MKMQIIALIIAIGTLICLSLPWMIVGSLYTKTGFYTNEGFFIMTFAIIVVIVSIINLVKRFQTYTRFYIFTGISTFILCLVFMVNTYIYATRFDERFEYFENINKIPVTPSNSIGTGVYICIALSIILVIAGLRNKQRTTFVSPAGLPPIPIKKNES